MNSFLAEGKKVEQEFANTQHCTRIYLEYA